MGLFLEVLIRLLLVSSAAAFSPAWPRRVSPRCRPLQMHGPLRSLAAAGVMPPLPPALTAADVMPPPLPLSPPSSLLLIAEQGFQMDPQATGSFVFIAVAFSGLMLAVNRAEAAQEKRRVYAEELRLARVNLLTQGPGASEIELGAMQSRLDALLAEEDATKSFEVFGLRARLMVPDKDAPSKPALGSPPSSPSGAPPEAEEPSPLNSSTVRNTILLGVLLLQLPLLALLLTDPVGQPGPLMEAVLTDGGNMVDALSVSQEAYGTGG